MMTIGLDVHKVRTTAVLLDEATDELFGPLTTDTAQVEKFVREMPGPVRVVMEAGPQSFILARALMSCKMEVAVVSCDKAKLALKLLHTAKTDRLDAKGLALAYARGWLEHARVWVADESTWQLRGLVRARRRLVRNSVGLQNQIHGFLLWVGERCPTKSVTTLKAAAWMDELEGRLPEPLALALQGLRGSLAQVCEQIARLEQPITKLAGEVPQCRRLQTVPGIGPILSATILAEVGDFGRFQRAEQLVSYCGLDPKTEESGESSREGEREQKGSSWLRWAMVEAAQHFVNSGQTDELSLKKFYQHLAFRKPPNKAKVALARRLVHLIFAMLRDETDFDPERLAA